MATKTKVKPDPVRSLLAWERFMDYALMDAMDGTFDAERFSRAQVAWSMNDHEAMEAIADEAKREVDFIESDVLFETLEKPKMKDGKTEREWTVAERYAILRETERTRAYARVKFNTLAENDNPFS